MCSDAENKLGYEQRSHFGSTRVGEVRRMLAAGIGVIASLSAAPVISAQESAGGIEEILVTALKRETALQDTPMAISAISSDQLEQSGAIGIEDYVANVPGLELRNRGPGQRRPIIRGISGPGEAQVGIYYDEIPFSGSPGLDDDAGKFSPDMNVFDIERVEALRGPQGTLYGAGSMGGTIRLITKQPDASGFAAKVGADVSSTAHGGTNSSTRGMVNFPLMEDKLAVRLVGYTRGNDGFIDNSYLFNGGGAEDINDEDATGGRAKILWTPADSLKITGTWMTEEVEGGSRFYVTDGHPNGEWWTDSISRDTLNDEWDAYNVTVEWSNDDLSFLWSSSRFDREVDFWRTSPSVNTIVNAPQTSDVTSHEARVVWTGLEGFALTAGVFNQEREADVLSRVVRPDPITGTELIPTIWRFSRFAESFSEQDAVFAEGTLDINDKLSVTTGLRWFDMKTENKNRTTNAGFLPPAVLAARGYLPNGDIPLDLQTTDVGESSSNDIIKKFQIDYRASDDVLLYFVYSEGFRAGGPNQVVVGATGIPEGFEPDTVTNYELGLKSTWLDNRLVFNASLFQIDWDDLQVLQQTEDRLFRYKGNAGSAEIQGLELELNYSATSNFDVSANIGYLHEAKLTDDQPQATDATTGLVTDFTTGLSGDRLPETPEITAGLALTYTRELGQGMDLILRGDVNYTDDRTSNFRSTLLDVNGNSSSTPNPDFKADDSYALLNLRAGIETEVYSISIWVRNVTDEMAIVSTHALTTPQWSFVLPPRTIGITFDYNFGG